MVLSCANQLCKTRERLTQLEEEYGNTESGSRVRCLKGTDADQKQMKLKHEHVSDYKTHFIASVCFQCAVLCTPGVSILPAYYGPNLALIE